MAKRKEPIETLHQGKFIRLVKQGRWEFAQRTKTSGIVMIVPVTRDGKLLLIEQFRPPVGKTVIELPAGLAGDAEGMEDEDLAEAAKRELLEETGYAAATMKRVAEGPPSAGMVSEIITIFLAGGLKKVGAGEGDGHEDITTHLVPLSRVESWLKRKADKNTIIDLKLWAGLYFARR
jgi:ADP-ribose pyrophosphatase